MRYGTQFWLAFYSFFINKDHWSTQLANTIIYWLMSLTLVTAVISLLFLIGQLYKILSKWCWGKTKKSNRVTDISTHTKPENVISNTSVTGAMQNKSFRYSNSEVTLNQINSKIGKNGSIKMIRPNRNEMSEKWHRDDPIYGQF